MSPKPRLRRWHYKDGPPPAGPFVSSARLLDIPNTLVGAIRSMPAGCVAVAIRAVPFDLSVACLADLERAARHKGLRLLWVRQRNGRLTADGTT